MSTLLLPIWSIWLIVRILRKKEDFKRILERFGIGARAEIDDKVIWIHAASVGEAEIAITLVNTLSNIYYSHRFLITTITTTSAYSVQSKLPPRTVHQYLPIDEFFCIKRFLKKWKPLLCIVIESDIWPNMVTMTSKICSIVIVNATMSDKSVSRWRICSVFANGIIQSFEAILCQNEESVQKYKMIGGRNVKNIGNIKYSASIPRVSQQDLEILNAQIGNRFVILAFSTHHGDEEIICKMHLELKYIYDNLLTIIAPRHPHRSEAITKIIARHNISAAIRSLKQEISTSTDIYVADTIGELGLFFSIAKISIVGGSFYHGGHNILEPAFFKTTIIFGPNMTNFKNIADEFLSENASFQANSINDLSKIIKGISGKDMNEMHEKASMILLKHCNVASSYVSEIVKYIK